LNLISTPESDDKRCNAGISQQESKVAGGQKLSTRATIPTEAEHLLKTVPDAPNVSGLSRSTLTITFQGLAPGPLFTDITARYFSVAAVGHRARGGALVFKAALLSTWIQWKRHPLSEPCVCLHSFFRTVYSPLYIHTYMDVQPPITVGVRVAHPPRNLCYLTVNLFIRQMRWGVLIPSVWIPFRTMARLTLGGT
jgi:hypothetical protein